MMWLRMMDAFSRDDGTVLGVVMKAGDDDDDDDGDDGDGDDDDQCCSRGPAKRDNGPKKADGPRKTDKPRKPDGAEGGPAAGKRKPTGAEAETDEE
jgi:hypothetical protein